MYRVAITGIGAVSCLGLDLDTISSALREGRSGVVVDEARRALGFRSTLTGMIDGFDVSGVLTRKARKTMPEYCIWAYQAAADALAVAGIDLEELKGDRQTGIIFGNDSSSLAAVEQIDKLRATRDTALLGSGLVFRSMTSNISMNLNALFATRGACWTLSSACSSGGHAVGQGSDLIALGKQRRVICGGAQEINPESMASFDGLRAFASRVDTPTEASRPFDASRDGLVPSGGAAAVVLEELESAKARGATILGEVVGYGFSSDGGHISVPSDTGIADAMTMALENAAFKPADIDYLCAHATSTPAGDRAEARNIRAVFGENTVPVSSLKAMTGHELWMAGASQVVYSTLMARDGFVAPNINFQTPDDDTRHLNVITETLHRPPELALLNSAGFGGTNSSLLLRFGS